MLARMLERLGLETLVAADGAQALAMAERYPGAIHLLLTDIVLPGIKGPELADILASRRVGMKTIFMSGYPDEVALRQARLDENTLFLCKPFATRELEVAVRRLVSHEAA